MFTTSALVVLFLFTDTVTDDGVLVSVTYTPALAPVELIVNAPVEATCMRDALVPMPAVPAAVKVTLPTPALIVPLLKVRFPEAPVAANVMLLPPEDTAPTE
jgi:hypothetical protein